MVNSSCSADPSKEDGAFANDRTCLGCDDVDDNEAAVERWLTSPALSLRPESENSFGGRHSSVGLIGRNEYSGPKSDTRTSVSSNLDPPRGKSKFRQRFRQRILKPNRRNESGGSMRSLDGYDTPCTNHQATKPDKLVCSRGQTAPSKKQELSTPKTETTITTSSVGTRTSMVELLKSCQDIEDDLLTVQSSFTESVPDDHDSSIGTEQSSKVVKMSSSPRNRDRRNDNHSYPRQTERMREDSDDFSAKNTLDLALAFSPAKHSPRDRAQASPDRSMSIASSASSSQAEMRSKESRATSTESSSLSSTKQKSCDGSSQLSIEKGAQSKDDTKKKKFFGCDSISRSSSSSTASGSTNAKDKDGPLRAAKSYSPRFSRMVGHRRSKEPVDRREFSSGQQLRQIRYEKRQNSCFGPGAQTNTIRLNIYDLIASETVMQLPWGCHFPIGQCFSVVNASLHSLGTGAYHVGVEINGIEYAYGANDVRGITGVFTCMPKRSPGYQFRQTIDFGQRTMLRTLFINDKGDELPSPPRPTNNSSTTAMTANPPGRAGCREIKRHIDGREVVREMAQEYLGSDYDLLRKNCVTFAHDACTRLGVRDAEIPTWFRNLCDAGALTQDAAEFTMKPLTRVLSACDCDVIEGALPDYVAETGFEVSPGKGNSNGIQVVKAESNHGGEADVDSIVSEDPFQRATTWRY